MPPTFTQYEILGKTNFNGFAKDIQGNDLSAEALTVLDNSKRDKTVAERYRINVSDAAAKGNLVSHDIQNKILGWHDKRWVNYISDGHRVKYTTEDCQGKLPTEPAEADKVATEIVTYLRRRLEERIEGLYGLHRLLADAASGKSCVHAAINNHYGFPLGTPDDKCGHCSGCSPTSRP